MENEVFGEAYRAALDLEQKVCALNQPSLLNRCQSLHITLSLRDLIYAETIIRQSDAIVIEAAELLKDEAALDSVMVAATGVKIQTLAYLSDHATLSYDRLSRKYGIGILAKS